MDSTPAPITGYVNWLVLGELGVVVIVACAFLLYFNRLLGSVFAFFIRLYTWRNHHAYITIGSLQFAPLAGRIAFRNVKYHSSNISVRVLHGHITFRYWAWRVRQEGDSQSSNGKRSKLPCRIVVFADGLEFFVYNRTPAYDAIVERMKKHERENDPSPSEPSRTSTENPIKVRLRKAFNTTHDEDGMVQVHSNISSDDPDKVGFDLPEPDHAVQSPQPEGVDWFREMLPVEFLIEKGSLVLGSDATPMVLIGDFKRATGLMEVTESRSTSDKYRMSVPLKFEEVKVLYRTNVEWSGPLLAHGKKVYDELVRQDPDFTKHPPSSISTKSAFIALARKFPFLTNPTFSKPPREGMPRDRTWRGLARYREPSAKSVPKYDREYAKVTTLIDTAAMDFTYYSDAPGPVPSPGEIDGSDPNDEYGNVDLPPEYGMDIVIHGGLVQYGPWADRQREALQKTFAPNIFFDTEPRPRLRPGEQRVHADMVLTVSFSEETNLRIPTREPSKDWQFDAKPEAELERRYGWLDVTTGADSTISYTQSQLATARGYDAKLLIHLDSLSIASSINLQSFVEAKSCRLTLSMPSPLRWNAQRDWGLEMNFDTPNITLLRDHVTLISDLAKDWSSGSAGDFHHFIPVHYNFRISMTNYAFHLYINDSNIVDRPQARDDNAFVDILGPSLSAYVAVGSTQYRPEFSVVPFSANLSDARVELSLPKWDTHRSFHSSEPLEVGRIGKGSIVGSYRYYSHPDPEHEEMLTLNVDASQVAFKCLGWVLRRLFCVKDNYFGAFTQFTTTQEYLERFDHDPDSVGDPVEEKYRPGRSDPFAVQVTLDVRDSLLLLSDEIYACRSGLALPIPQLQMLLKSVEGFMELSLDMPPTYIAAAPAIQAVYETCQAPPASSFESVFIEGIIVKANRLFGPQPRGTTYLCLWEIVLPKISAFLSPVFLHTVRSSITAVAFNFSDKENAPTNIYIPATPPDVTFFKLSIGSASIVFDLGETGLAVDLANGLKLDTSSLATLTASSSLTFLLLTASATLLSRPSPIQKWCSVGSIHSGVTVDIYKAPKEWQEKAAKQQKFLREQDAPTQRIWFMYSDKEDPSKEHYPGSSYPPRPHAMGNDEEDSDDDYLEDIESNSDTAVRPGADRRRSQTRSFRTAKETFHDSPSDESDDVSSVASSISSNDMPDSALPRDMASILADHAREFKKFRRAENLRSAGTETPMPPLRGAAAPLPSGSVFRIRIEPVSVDAGTRSVPSALAVMCAFDHNYARPTQLLDKILDQLVDEFSDRNDRPVPRILDITAPSVQVALSTNSPGLDKVSRLTVDISGIAARICQEPVDSTSPPNLSAAISLTSLRATLLAAAPKPPALSLRDIGAQLADAAEHPVLQLDQLGLTASFDDKANEKQARLQTNSTDLRIVSSALATAIQTADIWEKQISALKRDSKTPPLALLLGAIVEASSPNIENAPQPAFVSELTYELQVDDDRNLRRDHGWRVLSRLRQVLLQASLDTISEGGTSEAAVISGLSRLDWIPDDNNEDLTRQLTFVRKAFSLPGNPPTESSPSSQAAFISVENAVIRHYDYLLGTKRIGSSYIRIGTSSVGVYRNQQGQGEAGMQDRAVIAVSSIDAEVQDCIFSALRQITSSSSSKPSPNSAPSADAIILVNMHLGSADISIIAGGLKLRTVLANATGTVGHLQRQHKRHGLPSFITVRNDVNLVLDKADVVLWQPSDDENPTNSADREVIIVGILGVKLITDTQGSSKLSSVKEQRVMLALQSVFFDSRPTLRRALDFAQVWQERHYPHYEPTISHIRSSMAKNPARVPQPNQIPINLTFDFLVEEAALTVRTAKSAWIGWRLGRIYACEQGSIKNHSFGIRAAPQSIGFYSSRDLVKTKDTVKIDLPRVNVDGVLKTVRGQGNYEVELNLGHFDCIVKPSALDKLLSLYKTLVPEIRQLIKDYGSYAQTLFSPPSAPANSPPSKTSPLFRLQVGLEGVSIGLRADDVATTLLLRALALKGRATNRDVRGQALSWQVGVQHFEVSLGQIDHDTLGRKTDVSRKYKSAYMYLDVDVYESPSDTGAPSRLGISLSRIQTFMHIVALSEISDLISSWTSDLHVLTDQRGSEVAEVRQTTSRLLKKIDTSDRSAQAEESWFATRLLTIDIASFGLAVPLGAETVIDIRKQINSVTSALLFSVRSISFVNRRNETARFRVQHIGLQFVAKFDASLSEHFMGEFHASVNRMSLPLVDAEAQMSSKTEAWTLAAHCSATDFNLGLDPEFVEGIFQLIDLYEQGKDRVDVLEKRYRAELARNEATPLQKNTPDRSVTTRPNQRIFLRLSFTFESGKVRLYRAAEDGLGGIRGGWHDEVVLPGISVWMDYAGPSMDGLADKADSAGLLILNTGIHQSRNTLRPSILPFFVQVADRVEKRSKAKRGETKTLPHASPLEEEPAPTTVDRPAQGSTNVNRIRLTLRIDQSEILLACNPDSQAYVSLKWESGGFIGSTSFGATEISTFAGTISGVTTKLSHEYDQLGRSCIEASARDLAFSVIHTPDWRDGQAGISIVMDTRISAQFRLDLFSAWLTFISVWVDNAGLDAPIIAAMGDTSVAPIAVPPIASGAGKQVGVAILARFQAIEFDADVAVSHAKLKITPVVLHTLSNGTRTRVDLEVGRIEVLAQGDISGSITIDSFAFNTSRKSTRATEEIDPQLLSLALHTGHIRGSFFLRDSSVAKLHLGPSTVSLSDDWTDHSAPPLLAFAVQAGQFSLVARLFAIPRLLGKVYEILDAVGAQHRIAAQRSETFKAHSARKTHEPSPISAALAQTMQRTASHQSQAADAGDTAFSQTMRFALAGMNIGLFIEGQDGNSTEFYRFVVGAIGADLLRMPRKIDGEERPFRNLALSIEFLRWEKTRSGRQAGELERKDISAEEIMALAAKIGGEKVADLSSMDLMMDSDEIQGTPIRILYHFTLVWGQKGAKQKQSDISILPSVFDTAWKALKLVIAGVEREEAARARRLGVIRPNKALPEEENSKPEKDNGKDKIQTGKKKEADKDADNPCGKRVIHFAPRNPSIELDPPVPQVQALGTSTDKVAKYVPRFYQGVQDLPKTTHRFVTTPLEEAMDLLLRLYAKQLPMKKG